MNEQELKQLTLKQLLDYPSRIINIMAEALLLELLDIEKKKKNHKK